MDDATETTDLALVERKRCLAIVENHMNGHRRSLMGRHLSEADRARHRQAIASLETVAERIADP